MPKFHIFNMQSKNALLNTVGENVVYNWIEMS